MPSRRLLFVLCDGLLKTVRPLTLTGQNRPCGWGKIMMRIIQTWFMLSKAISGRKSRPQTPFWIFAGFCLDRFERIIPTSDKSSTGHTSANTSNALLPPRTSLSMVDFHQCHPKFVSFWPLWEFCLPHVMPQIPPCCVGRAGFCFRHGWTLPHILAG